VCNTSRWQEIFSILLWLFAHLSLSENSHRRQAYSESRDMLSFVLPVTVSSLNRIQLIWCQMRRRNSPFIPVDGRLATPSNYVGAGAVRDLPTHPCMPCVQLVRNSEVSQGSRRRGTKILYTRYGIVSFNAPLDHWCSVSELGRGVKPGVKPPSHGESEIFD